MAIVEMDDKEVAALKAGYALLDSMMKNPKTKADTEKLIKTVKPDVVTSADVLAPATEEIKKLREDFEGFAKKAKEERQDADLKAGFDSLRKRGYQDEGVEAIQKLMIERNIPDIEAAAALFDRLNPPKSQAPSGFAGTEWGFGRQTDDPDLKLLFGDPDAWADKEIGKVLSETRSEG